MRMKLEELESIKIHCLKIESSRRGGGFCCHIFPSKCIFSDAKDTQQRDEFEIMQS